MRSPFTFCISGKSVGQLSVVAQFRVSVQRQMIGEKPDVMRNQPRNTAVLPANKAWVLTAPEITMMYEQGVCTCFYSGLNEIQRGRYTANQMMHLTSAFHLQPIWAIITEMGNVQELVQIDFELIQSHHIRLVFIKIILNHET